MDFYTYLWLREDGTPFYVGKGHGTRAYDRRLRGPQPPERERILIEYHPSEIEAFEAEQTLISIFGRKDLGQGCLRNMTDGGEGSKGVARKKWHHTPEARARIRESLMGNKRGVGHSNHTQPHSDETKARMAAAKLGRKLSEEHRRNIGLSSIGNRRACKPARSA